MELGSHWAGFHQRTAAPAPESGPDSCLSLVSWNTVWLCSLHVSLRRAPLTLRAATRGRVSCSAGTGSVQRLQPNGWLPVPTHTHTHTSSYFPLYGPVAQRHLWAQLPSCFHQLAQYPVSLGKVTNEVRAHDRSSLNLSADLALLSLWRAQGDKKTLPLPHHTLNPGNRAATGKDAMFYPAGVHSTNRSQRLAVPSGAHRNLLFPSDDGRKTRRMCWKTVIE